MSTKAFAETNKKASQTIVPARGLKPQRRLAPPRQVEEAPTHREGSLSQTPREIGFGHDFSQVRVHSEQAQSGRATHPVAESCPLGLTSPRYCPFGGACHSCPPRIQAKVTIGQPGDKYEREADRVAEQVMRMPDPHLQRQIEPEEEEEETLQTKPMADQITPFVQGQVEPEEEEEEPIQAKQVGGQTPQASSSLEAQVRSLRDGGQPLPETERAFFEPRFGHDFSQVRIHTDGRSAEVTRAVNARSFTIGREVVFEAGQYAPETTEGKKLLAHELTHVVQQQRDAGLARSALEVAPTSDAYEQEARRVADQVVASGVAVANDFTPAQPRLQRLGDLSKKPLGLACPVATTSPASVVKRLFFASEVHALNPAHKTEIESFVIAWNAAGTNPDVRVDGYASKDGTDEFNWTLSCNRAQSVANELVSPSSGISGIPAAHITFVAQGETDEFSSSLAPNRRAAISTLAPLPAPVCTHPGESRTLDLQPVFFRSSAADPSPTGGSWRRRFNEANRIWGKLGVEFRELTRIMKDDPTNKTAGGTKAELIRIGNTESGGAIEVFLVDNDMTNAGGGATDSAGTDAAKVIMSDRGTSDTLLAHELGHVLLGPGPALSGGHPPAVGDRFTIMEPGGSHSVASPPRNTMANYRAIVFPRPTGSTCLTPDP